MEMTHGPLPNDPGQEEEAWRERTDGGCMLVLGV